MVNIGSFWTEMQASLASEVAQAKLSWTMTPGCTGEEIKHNINIAKEVALAAINGVYSNASRSPRRRTGDNANCAKAKLSTDQKSGSAKVALTKSKSTNLRPALHNIGILSSESKRNVHKLELGRYQSKKVREPKTCAVSSYSSFNSDSLLVQSSVFYEVAHL